MTEPTPSPIRRWFADDRVFAGAITFIFFVAATFNVWHHVMWRDEVRVWQIAAASPTLAVLHRNLR